VDRAIREVENIGKQMESVVSSAATSKTRENGYHTASDREQIVKQDGLENETRRWGRCVNRVSPTLEVDSQMEDSSGETSLQQRSSVALDVARQHSGGNVDSAQLRSLPRRTLPEIPRNFTCAPSTSTTLDRQELELPAPMVESPPPTTADEISETSRPTSAEYDDVSTSSGSRDEGFESAVDNGSLSTRSSAWSYPDFDVQTSDDQLPSTSQELVVDEKSTATTPCDVYESVSAGTSFFARSIDSLVSPELVVSGDTIDIDQLDTDMSVQDSTKESIADSPARVVRPGKDAGASVTNHKSSSSKSSLLANLTARLTRPKKSISSVSPTTNSTSKLNGKVSASSGAASARTGGLASGTAAGASTKSSSFTRGSLLRATMPASLHTRTKSTPSSAASKDSLAPEPPQRTTSIRGSIQTVQRPSPVTSRKPNSAPSSARKTDKQITQQPCVLPARSRVPAGEQTKDKTRSNVPEASGGRDKLVLYKVVDKTSKSSPATTSNSNSSKKQAVNANNDQHRTQRLVSFNTPQQSRTFRF